MICEFCSRWAAATPDQHRWRAANLKRDPSTSPHACPRCGGTEWATTTLFIDAVDAYEPPRRRARGLVVVAVVALALFAAVIVGGLVDVLWWQR